MHFAAFLDVGESVREPARYYRNNVVGALGVLEAMAAESVRLLRVLVDLRDLRRADRDADRRNASAAADQQLRRDQAGGRAGAAALRARARPALGGAALFQRRGRRSGRRDRRGSLAGDSPDSARDRGGDRRAVACRCSATTIRRPTAPACATTSTCPTWPTRTCGRSTSLVETGKSGAYNLGTGQPHSVREVIDAVERVTGRPVPWTLAPRRAGRSGGAVRGGAERRRPSCAGRRASPISRRSSARPGTGIRAIRTGTPGDDAGEAPAGVAAGRSVVVGGHAGVQRARHDRGDHPARARRAAAHRAHRRRRCVDRRDAGDSAGARAGAVVQLLLQPHNRGKGAALRRGFAEVTGDIVVIQDADLEYSPEEYPELIELICSRSRGCRLRVAVHRPAPRVPVHAFPGQPGC